MRILITGSNGLLGQKIVKQCLSKGLQFLATSKGDNRNPDCPNDRYLDLDITNPIEISKVFDFFYPTHVIHTAAITNVDYCETHIEECQQVNVIATQNLFEASKRYHSHFQFLSTDFVFDGEKGNYNEDDVVGPLSIYAKSKVEGENILLSDNYKNWSISRTIIVYGKGNNLSRTNLILWSIDALKKGDEIKVVDDQFRAPTWADDLAWGCLRIVELNKTGIYHLSGPLTYSILEIVNKVADYYQLDKTKIIPIKSDTLNQPAKRPPLTGFDLTKSRNDLGYNPLTLEETFEILQKQL